MSPERKRRQPQRQPQPTPERRPPPERVPMQDTPGRAEPRPGNPQPEDDG